MDQETRAVLINAKAALSEGWIQGQARTDKGVCLYGSLFCNTPQKNVFFGIFPEGRGGNPGPGEGWTWTWDSTHGKAIQALADTLGIDRMQLATWNDHPDRTHTEVVALIDRTLTANLIPNPQDQKEPSKTSSTYSTKP